MSMIIEYDVPVSEFVEKWQSGWYAARANIIAVDFEGDRYADPDHDSESFPFELATIVDIEVETADCVRIDYDNGSVGVPFGHTLKEVRGDI